MKTSRLFLGAALAVIASAACGGSTDTTAASTSSGSGGSGGSGPTPMEACAALNKARCEKIDACSNNIGDKVRYGDEATCESRNASPCVSALGAEKTGATPAGFEACATAIGTETCDDFLNNNPPSACLPAVGGLANGAACGANAQCMTSFCQVEKNAVCGVCAAEPMVGATCDTGADCAKDQICARDAMTMMATCAVPVANGGACDKSHPCGAALTCVGAMPNMMVMGKCMPAGAKVGDACDPQHKTAAGCDASFGLYCSPATNTCASTALVAAGQPCGVIGTGMTATFAACISGAECILANGSKSGTCVAPAADGAACDTALGPPCLAPAKCVVPMGMTAGKCTVPDATMCK